MCKRWTRKKNKIKERDGQKCLLCGITENLTVDHIIPKCMGGTDRESNLQTLCFDCNFKKGGGSVIDLRDNANRANKIGVLLRALLGFGNGEVC